LEGKIMFKTKIIFNSDYYVITRWIEDKLKICLVSAYSEEPQWFQICEDERSLHGYFEILWDDDEMHLLKLDYIAILEASSWLDVFSILRKIVNYNMEVASLEKFIRGWLPEKALEFDEKENKRLTAVDLHYS
jgi:hypothetical protein